MTVTQLAKQSVLGSPHSCTGRDKCNTSAHAHTQHCHRSRPAQQGDDEDGAARRVSSSRCHTQFCMDLHSEQVVRQNANQQNWVRDSAVRTRTEPKARRRQINKTLQSHDGTEHPKCTGVDEGITTVEMVQTEEEQNACGKKNSGKGEIRRKTKWVQEEKDRR